MDTGNQTSRPRLFRLRGLSRGVIGVLIVLAVLVGCGFGANFFFSSLRHIGCEACPPSPQVRGYTYAQPTQKEKGGTITYGDWQLPSTTNPWFSSAPVDLEVQDALWDRPVIVTPEGRYLPSQLAEVPTTADGDVSQDGLTVVLKLRSDLKWSDGQPLTADDCVFWLEALLDPATGAANTSGYRLLASYQAVDAHTVLLKYRQPFGGYLNALPFAAPRHAWGTIPHKDLAKTLAVNLAPRVNSGPFLVKELLPGQRFTLVPNPNYTSTYLHPSVLDQLVFVIYPTKAALIAAYQTGTLDHAEDFTLQDLARLAGLAGLQISPSINEEQLLFNLQTPALQDLHVRTAILQAIDRCQIIESVLDESCANLLAQAVEPCPHPDCDASIKLPPFDLHAARQDMQAAGWDCSGSVCMQHGQAFPTLRLAASDDNTLSASVAGLIRQDLGALGIPVVIPYLGVGAGPFFGDYSNGILAQGKYDLALFPVANGLDSDANLYGSFHSSQIPSAQNPGGENWGRVNAPNVDALLDAGRTTLDQAKRSNIYRQLQQYLAQQVYVLPLYLLPNITLTATGIGNYAPNPLAGGNAWNISEWYQKSPA